MGVMKKIVLAESRFAPPRAVQCAGEKSRSEITGYIDDENGRR